jgi:hypothetical protein
VFVLCGESVTNYAGTHEDDSTARG